MTGHTETVVLCVKKEPGHLEEKASSGPLVGKKSPCTTDDLTAIINHRPSEDDLEFLPGFVDQARDMN